MASPGIWSPGRWSPEVEKVFIKVLADHVNKGGIHDNFVWKLILDELNMKTRRSFSLIQIKLKFHWLRIKYHAFSELLLTTGFSWNVETNTLTAEDSVWQSYIQKHPEAAPFRKWGFEHFKLMANVFNTSTTTGLLHHASTIDLPNSDEEQLDNECVNDRVHVDVEDEAVTTHAVEHTTCGGKRTTTMAECKPEKVFKSTPMGDALQAQADASKARLEASLANEGYKSKSVEATSSVTSVDCSVDYCVDALNEMENVSDDAYIKALEKFTSHEWRRMFLKMPIERKKAWVERL
ncbi:uncharacterized protein At2g29880-like [Gastrolobium bilobum]|uniref:uncharacterized protein At2g29880-like n=1 Tax=Gastrolobium bilobum TaxID=150636 RepID=UPI002AB1F5C7|nr:uncharacterized protein At2g29880-like [Gastrolobium bilobum]